MRTMAMGEYYVWYCEWCDSRNLTPWGTAAGGRVNCGCCHKEFAVAGARHKDAGADRHAAHF